MDQVKEILKQAIKYRFWIVVGVSALLPLIAYFVAAGSLKAEETQKKGEIEGAYKDVKQYESGVVPNADYKRLVNDKTQVLTKDVNASWRKLYARQAPLLTWPKEVEDKFPVWGDKWPDGVDSQLVTDSINTYIEVYPNFVTEVYKTFKPFEPTTGKGIVASAPESALLQPFVFKVESPPGLGRVWAAQQKLWVQRTILDVIANVNEKAKAKDWDTAVIKQLLDLQVAAASAVDQRSAAKGEALVDAPEILPPGAAAADATKTSTTTQQSGGMSDMSRMMGSMGGMGGMMGGGSGSSEVVQFLTSPNPDQYNIVPIYLSVYVDQDHIIDLLEEFSRSPMAIQVLDFEMSRPQQRVRKPKKGEDLNAFGGMMGGGFGGRMGRMMGGEALFGGGSMMNQMMGGTEGENMMSSMGGNMGMMMQAGQVGGMAGMMGAPGSNAPRGRQGGVDVRSENLKKARDKRDKEKESAKKKGADEETDSKIADPYYNIVEIHISGQARFYKTPPKDEAPPETAATEANVAADAPKADAAKPDANAQKSDATKPAAAKDIPAKAADTPPAEAKKDEPPKKDEPKPDAKNDEPAKKDEAPAPEPKKDVPAKKDEAKPAASKDEPAKAEQPAPKTDAPTKGDNSAPKKN